MTGKNERREDRSRGQIVAAIIYDTTSIFLRAYDSGAWRVDSNGFFLGAWTCAKRSECFRFFMSNLDSHATEYVVLWVHSAQLERALGQALTDKSMTGPTIKSNWCVRNTPEPRHWN